jgi:hypothetical protein
MIPELLCIVCGVDYETWCSCRNARPVANRDVILEARREERERCARLVEERAERSPLEIRIALRAAAAEIHGLRYEDQ